MRGGRRLRRRSHEKGQADHWFGDWGFRSLWKRWMSPIRMLSPCMMSEGSFRRRDQRSQRTIEGAEAVLLADYSSWIDTRLHERGVPPLHAVGEGVEAVAGR